MAMDGLSGSASKHLSNAVANSNQQVDPNNKLFAGLEGADKDRAMAQYALQKQQETVAFLSNISKKLNEIAMATINNMR
ncbi:hypothetical protein [Archangium sp.]|uniref:hypothetical protein n=1 Tax=Archangium sp. TaxID=1872627 RepID=UPI003899AA22